MPPFLCVHWACDTIYKTQLAFMTENFAHMTDFRRILRFFCPYRQNSPPQIPVCPDPFFTVFSHPCNTSVPAVLSRSLLPSPTSTTITPCTPFCHVACYHPTMLVFVASVTHLPILFINAGVRLLTPACSPWCYHHGSSCSFSRHTFTRTFVLPALESYYALTVNSSPPVLCVLSDQLDLY